MSEWVWPDLQAIIDFQNEQIKEHGGLHGVKDQGALEAALARPQQRAAYGEPAPDGAELAAAHAFGLAKAHAFNDGNKRIAWVAARLFLIENGLRLHCTDEQAIEMMLGLSAGDLSESGFAVWIRDNLDLDSREPVKS